MSKNLKINETEYNGVSLVTIPTTDGGTASFKDVEEVVTPSGKLSVTENGTYNVEEYASVDVNVEAEATGGVSLDNIVMGVEPSGDVVLETATKIKKYMFTGMNTITTLRAPNVITIEDSAFQLITKEQTELENIDIPNCEIIGNYVFSFNQGLKNLVFPKVKSLGNMTFSMCVGLETVKFGTKLTFVGTNPFNGCTQNFDIYVPWSEGEVTWTVPDTCTVHYNTVYDENWNVVSST